MNERIKFKYRTLRNQGYLLGVFDQMSADDIINRIWALMKALKKMGLSNEPVAHLNKMQIFNTRLFNTKVTKRDVKKYVKALKPHFQPHLIVFRPCREDRRPNTWTTVCYKHSDNHFISRWFKSLTNAQLFILHTINLGKSFKSYQKFLKRVLKNYRKRKSEEAKA